MNILLLIGALLMPVGAIVNTLNPAWGAALYCLGTLCFCTHSALHISDSHPADHHPQAKGLMRKTRLRLWISLLWLSISAVFICLQAWDYTQAQWRFPWSHRNIWVAFCLIGILIHLYGRWRMEREHKRYTDLLPLLVLCLASSSCAEGYVLQGSTNIHALEGEMLYLKAYENQQLKDIDSAHVIHGKFVFQGHIDSTLMVNLFAAGQSLMPVVLENTKLFMRLNDMEQIIEGSELNDSLCIFIHRKSQLDNLMAELPRKEGRMIMDGMNFDDVAQCLNQEYARLATQSDKLVVSFIKRNYYNVLGPGIFMIMTSGMPYPMLTPRIEEITATAPAQFLQNPYVKDFLEKAHQNKEKWDQ